MLEDNMYLMDKGVRDCCELLISGSPSEIGDQLYDIEAQAAEHKYNVLAFRLQREEGETNECHSVFICKYNYQKILLTKLYNEVKPHSFIYEYMMGTLLGYSAASMEEFLMRKCTDIAIGMSQYIDENKEDPEEIEEEKEAKTYINDRRSEFDKDAWQVLMLLNNNCTPVSEKINTLLDLLYTHTDDPKEKNLLHNLTVAMPNRNKPDFTPCIKILERYFHVDTEDEETDIPSVEDIGKKNVMERLDTKWEDNYYSTLKKLYDDITFFNHKRSDFSIHLVDKVLDKLVNDRNADIHLPAINEMCKVMNSKNNDINKIKQIKVILERELEYANSENRIESRDKFKANVHVLYRDLERVIPAFDGFLAILNNFLTENEATTNSDRVFKQSLKYLITNNDRRDLDFTKVVLDRIRIYLNTGK